MKHTKLRRVLTFIFTLTFITSTVMGTLPAFSLNADKTDLVEVTNGSYYVTAGKVGETVNVLKGIQPYINEYVAPAGTVDAEDKSTTDAGGSVFSLTDGNFDSEWAPVGKGRPFHNGDGDWFFDGSVYNKLAFDLGKATDITDIMVAHSTTNGLTTGEYKVYVSDAKDTLFSAVNLVAEVVNTTKLAKNVISTKSGETLSGRYVGFVVTNPGNDYTAWNGNRDSYYTRIREIAVFAADTSSKTPRATVSDLSESAELPALDAANGELNLTNGKAGKYYSNAMGNGLDNLLSPSEEKLKVLTDGDTTTDTEAKADNDYKGAFLGYEYRFGSNNPPEFFNNRASVAFTYDLGATFELTKFVLINHANDVMATSRYMIYASNSESSLFDDSSFVVDVKNPDGLQRNIVTFNEGVNARYVGVRIYDPSTDYTATVLAGTPTNAYFRARELAFYGKTTASDELFSASADDNWETDTSLGDSNILSGVQTESIKMHRPSGVDTSTDTNGKLTDGDITTDAGEWRNGTYKFTDGTNVIGNGINLGDYYLDITFSLGGTYAISGFEVFNSKTYSGGLATKNYQVYASMNSSDLFSASNMIVSYVNDRKAHNSFKLASGKTAPEAKFYGIRVLDPTCDKDNVNNISPRIRELTLYGKKVVSLADAIINDDKLEFVTSYEGTNLAPNAAYESKFMDLNGNYTVVTSNGDAFLTDGALNNDYRTSSQKFKDSTGTKWIGNGIEEGEIYQDLIFDLKYIAKLTGLTVINHSSNNLGTKKYDIYFSDTKADLFKGEPFCKMDNVDGNARNSFDLKKLNGDAPKSARFVGIRVLDPTAQKPSTIDIANAYLRLLEIAIYGELTDEGADPYIPVVFDSQAKIPTDYEGDNIALQAKYEGWYLNPESNSREKVTPGDEVGGAKLTDGDVATEFRDSSKKFGIIDNDNPDNNKWLGNGLEEGDVYQDIIIDLNYISNINGLSLIFSPTNGLATHKYSLYFGNEKKTLFNGEAFREVVNSEGAQRNMFDLKHLNGNQAVSARFVGIRITDATVNKPPAADIIHLYVRVREISVFGALTSEGADPEPDLNVINDDVIAIPEDWGTNIALGKQPKTYVNDKSGYHSTSAKGNINLSDGDVNSEFEEQTKLAEVTDQGILKKDHTFYGDGDWYTDIVYDFLTEVSVDGFALIHHSASTMITRRYQIYVADKRSEIFESQNLVCDVVNEDPFRRNGINFKGKDMSKKGRYFAIRVLAPTEDPSVATSLYGTQSNSKNETVAKNHVSTRLFELAIYGSYTDPNYVYVPNFTPMVATPEDSYFDGNLLLNRTADEIYYNSQRYAGLRDKVGYITDGLTVTPYGEEIGPEGDLRKLTHVDFGTLTFTATDGSQYVDFYWDLKKKYAFSKFAMLSQIGDTPSHYTGWYRVYISDDLDLLFDDSSIAFEYNALDEDEPDEICKGQIKDFTTPVVGRYMAVRILNPVYTASQWVRPRIVEVGIWGEEAKADLTPTNLTSDMPVNAYLGELGALEEIKDLTLKDLNNLSDGDNATGASIKTGGKKLHIIYNLCQEADIYSLVINSLKGENSLKKYNVYTADSQSAVWDDSSLVYSHKGKGDSGEKKFSTPKAMRFIRIEILDEVDTVYVGDVLAIGPKDSLLRSKILNKNISDNSYTFFEQDMKTGEIKYIEAADLGLNSKIIHDGAINLATSMYGGVRKEKSLNVTIDLGDIRNVNSFRLDFPLRGKQYYPTETYVYFGSDANELEKVDAEPTFSFKGELNKTYFEETFVPRSCRFVRISFVNAPENGVLEDMIIALNEITVTGTGVVGMNVEGNNVMDFEDKKLGMKWGIAKATTNDVINTIASSEIVVSDSTNWQKRSLEKTPYLKVVGGKNYEIKFYDIVGNEVTDLEGRKVEVSYKLKDGITAATSMIGYSGNKWYIEPYETLSDRYDGYVTSYTKGEIDSYTFSLLEIISSDDEYWSTIGELEDYGDEKPQYAPNVDLDENFSYDPIVTEDEQFYVSPVGALKLPTDAMFYVQYTTYTIDPVVYDEILPLTDPNYLAATYYLDLMQNEMKYEFDGKIKVMLTIPEVLDGVFSGYKLIHIFDEGGAEFIDCTRDGDKIYFETTSLSKFALIGEGYNGSGNAAPGETPDGNTNDEDFDIDDSLVGDGTIDDGFYDDNLGGDSYEEFVPEDMNNGDVIIDEYAPETGENSPAIYFIISIVSLAVIVLLNSKKLFKA